jgi:hypothetical protein
MVPNSSNNFKKKFQGMTSEKVFKSNTMGTKLTSSGAPINFIARNIK